MAFSEAERAEPNGPDVDVELDAFLSDSSSQLATPSPAVVSGEAKYVGRYRLCFELSSGGMASVYLARVDGPARFRKLVALKRIHPHLAKVGDFIEMFLDEAALAARIDHPNVCSVFDFGRESDGYFLAMEYLVGEPLSRLLRLLRKRPPEDMARHAAMVARVIADACEGLHAAHELRNERGEPMLVVHRDISPDNIFVTYDGIPKIVDFGIASARERIHETSTGLVKGKHAYMAPEQLGEGPVDRRADVWSMGVVLWESLCLRRLFKRETHAKTLYAVTGDVVPSPSVVQPSLPRGLDAVVERALTRDLDARCPSARELSNDLRRFLTGLDEPIGAPEVSEWLQQLVPDGRRRKRQLVEIAMSLSDEPAGTAFEDAEPTDVERDPRHRRRWAIPALGAVALLAVGVAAYVGHALGAEDAHPAEPSAEAAPTPGERGLEDHSVPAVAESTATGPRTPEPEPAGPESDGAEATRVGSAGSAPEGSGSDPARSEEAASDRAESEGAAPEAADERPRARGRGSVLVLLPPDIPWAHVYHRGRRLPATAPGSFQLPAGRQVLEVRPMGRAPARRVVAHVRGGRRVTVRLPP